MTKNITSIRRLTENEAMFRKHNEKVTKELAEVERKAASSREEKPVDFSNLVLHFFCECADEDCLDRIKIKVGDYTTLHQQRDHFVVKVGHQVKGVEKVIKKFSQYLVVQKLLQVPENPGHFNKTQISNA